MKNPAEDKPRVSMHPLAGVPGLSGETLHGLRGHWIETAEQVLAIAASPDGRHSLGRLLALDERALNQLVELLADHIGAEQARQFCEPKAGGPLGAILTEEQKRRFGLEYTASHK